MYLPDPQTTKRNKAKSQGPTGDPSSCDFYKKRKFMKWMNRGYIKLNIFITNIYNKYIKYF
jgi:hypothetical protein